MRSQRRESPEATRVAAAHRSAGDGPYLVILFRCTSEAEPHHNGPARQRAALFRGIGRNTELSSLFFDAYDSPHPVNEISVVDDDGDEVAVWQDEDLRLRLAALDLLETVGH